MVPLDPPFAEGATVGGVIAANSSGPRRRLYGTARDLVIGMRFATLEGKLVQAGGMVVKNVAGLDMAKLMIGSFGTLAAIATVNFKLQPMPQAGAVLFATDSAAAAVAARDGVLKSQLQPAAIDILNRAGQPALAEAMGAGPARSAAGSGSATSASSRSSSARGPLRITTARAVAAPGGTSRRISTAQRWRESCGYADGTGKGHGVFPRPGD
jgi:glycolate oxidase FAD binding subunit